MKHLTYSPYVARVLAELDQRDEERKQLHRLPTHRLAWTRVADDVAAVLTHETLTPGQLSRRFGLTWGVAVRLLKAMAYESRAVAMGPIYVGAA